MIFCAASASFQRFGSSALAFSSARRRWALSQSKMPPQQPDRLLGFVYEVLDFGAHDRSVKEKEAASYEGRRLM
jgi:hypothetical protein